MRNTDERRWAAVMALLACMGTSAAAQQNPAERRQAPPQPFRWVNPLPEGRFPHVEHRTFKSPSMGVDVGYCIQFPPGYDAAADRRYPVIYYLHGGRPGDETKSVGLSSFFHDAMHTGKAPPAIYVYVNGGPVSHYNMPDRPDAQGEDVFIHELIPHVDATYRTIAARGGRAIEGFSQGGRGTARIIFKHPELFCSAAPGGGGHATEKRVSENAGRESDSLRFAAGDNTWDLAAMYAARPEPKPHPRLLVFVGTQDFNYEGNLAWMAHLEMLGIPFERLIVDDAPHSAKTVYEKAGTEIMQFHAQSFQRE